MTFRKQTPKRRNITRSVSTHRDHRDDLKRDFNSRCGYCDDIDTWRVIWFEIDHFIPEKILKSKTPQDYSNLVYSCRSCNNAKRANWPSNDENIPIVNNEGFIDPCEDEFQNQFSRESDGSITPNTEIGSWMYLKLKLHKPQHQIIWTISLIDDMIDEIEGKINGANVDQAIKDSLLDLYRKFRDYQKMLSNC